MRLSIALAIVGVVAVSTSALAQRAPSGATSGRQQLDARNEKYKATKPDEQAYKDALTRIQPKKPADPWSSMR